MLNRPESPERMRLWPIPPTKQALAPEQLLEYYSSILQEGELPVIVQDASGYLGNEIPLKVSQQLFAEFGSQQIMFKPEANPMGPRLSLLRDATNREAKIFEGSGGISLMDSYHRGITGTIRIISPASAKSMAGVRTQCCRRGL